MGHERGANLTMLNNGRNSLLIASVILPASGIASYGLIESVHPAIIYGMIAVSIISFVYLIGSISRYVTNKKSNSAKRILNKKQKLFLQFISILTISVLSILQLTSLGSGIYGKVLDIKTGQKERLVNVNRRYVACSGNLSTFEGSFIPKKVNVLKSGKKPISIDLPIETVPLKNATWEVKKGIVGYADHTSPISLAGGNVGIFADDSYKDFSAIKNLNSDDLVYVYGENNNNTLLRASFRVKSATVTKPTNAYIFYPTTDSELTIITADGSFSKQKFAVKTELVVIEEMECSK